VKANYNLSKKIAGFDFFPWLVMQAAHGATEIVFDKTNPNTSKWPLHTVMNRFESILRPGPALLGLPHSFGKDGGQLAPYHQSDLVKMSRAGVKFPKLKTVLPPGNERYTITLRNTQRAAGRNSRADDWKAFAKEIGALIIPDYDDKAIGLHERMALYAGAEMNFFVSNGPGILCSFTEYPCMIFDCHLAAGSLRHDGIDYGKPYPWMIKNQYTIWEPATLENIRRYFKAWKGGLLVAPDSTAP